MIVSFKEVFFKLHKFLSKKKKLWKFMFSWKKLRKYQEEKNWTAFIHRLLDNYVVDIITIKTLVFHFMKSLCNVCCTSCAIESSSCSARIKTNQLCHFAFRSIQIYYCDWTGAGIFIISEYWSLRCLMPDTTKPGVHFHQVPCTGARPLMILSSVWSRHEGQHTTCAFSCKTGLRRHIAE